MRIWKGIKISNYASFIRFGFSEISFNLKAAEVFAYMIKIKTGRFEKR